MASRASSGRTRHALPAGPRDADYTRWEANIQRDLGKGFIAQFTYLGSRGHNIPVVQQVNNIPIQYLSTSRSRDAANDTFLTTNVPSPFTNLLPGSTINGATVQRLQLLRPFPEFGTLAFEQYTGSDRYNAGTVQLEKRFRGGNSLTLQYTHSRLHDKLNYLNPADGVLEDRLSPNDRPNRFSMGSSIRVPYGRGEKWGSNINPAVDALIGGWQVSGTYQYQSGFPLSWNTSLYFDPSCNPASLVSHIGEKINGGIGGLDVPAWDTSCFYFHDSAVQVGGVDNPTLQRNDPRIQLGNNVRYMPSTFPNLRADNLHLLDIGLYKNFGLPHSSKLQLRFELINALNYTVLFSRIRIRATRRSGSSRRIATTRGTCKSGFVTRLTPGFAPPDPDRRRARPSTGLRAPRAMSRGGAPICPAPLRRARLRRAGK